MTAAVVVVTVPVRANERPLRRLGGDHQSHQRQLWGRGSIPRGLDPTARPCHGPERRPVSGSHRRDPGGRATSVPSDPRPRENPRRSLAAIRPDAAGSDGRMFSSSALAHPRRRRRPPRDAAGAPPPDEHG